MNRIKQQIRVRMIIGLAAGLLASVPAGVLAKGWTNTTTSSWETPNNWNPVGAPANADTITTTATGPYTININNTTANTGTTDTWLKVGQTTINAPGTPTLSIDFTNTARTVIASGIAIGDNYSGNNSRGALIMNNGSLDTPGSMLIGGNAASGNGTLTVNGGVLHVQGFLDVGNVAGSTGTIWVTGGVLSNNNQFIISNGGVGVMVVSNGTVATPGLYLGYAGTGAGTLNIYGGTVNGDTLVGLTAGSTNTVLVAGGTLNCLGNGLNVGYAGTTGSLTLSNGIVNATQTFVGRLAGSNGTLNQYGGMFTSASTGFNLMVGVNSTGQFNLYGGTNIVGSNFLLGTDVATLGGTGTVVVSGGRLSVNGGSFFSLGGANGGVGSLIVSNGEVHSAGSIRLGEAASGQGNLSIYGGTVDLVSTLSVGLTAGATGRVDIAGSGVLQANTISISPAGTGWFTNRVGGTVRFTTANPTITLANGGQLVVTNAAVEFKDQAAANTTGNIISQITYLGGNNTLRLNNSTNLSVASAVFSSSTNFSTLAMVNGNTRWNGNFLTTGSGGSVLLTNTQATFSGVFTNQGTFSSYHSSATFEGKVVNSGAWITDPSTNTFLADYSLTSTGYVQMAAGDVYTFKSNFINQSTQSNTYDTVAGKFLFNGTSVTQTFFTAGKDLGPEAGYTPGRTNNILPGTVFGTGPGAANFALGTLEISNSSTVKVSDAFSVTLSNDDGQRAALYLDQLILDQNSWLIIDTNVTVYFRGSNDWAAANAGVSMLFDGELHQLVPEPSILLLWAGGLGVVGWLRRRSVRK